MIYLETPKKFRGLIDQAQHVAQEIFRPNSRRYDLAEHAYPKELDMLGALLDGLNASGAEGAGAVGGRGDRAQGEGNRNGGRSEARRVGQECVRTCRARGASYH